MSETELRATEQSGESAGAEPGAQMSLWTGSSAAEASPAGDAAQPEAQIPYPEWTLTDLGAFVLFAAFAFPGAFFATAIIFLGLRQVFGWELSVEEAFMRAPVAVMMQTTWELLWLAFIYFTVTIKYRREFWDALRWTRGAGSDIHPMLRPRNWVAGGALLALAAQFYFLVAPSEKEVPIDRMLTDPLSGYVLAAFGILVAPFIEELVFRGYVYPVFERLWGLHAAALATALLFALIHLPQLWGGWEYILVIFVAGAAFSYARGKTGSLVPSYLLHLGYNTALFVLLYVSTDGFRTL
jgi:membrane protease YdiL (CAAX protease family)